MIRIGKLTDYSLVILSLLARSSQTLLSSNQVVEQTGIQKPTVAKLMKHLTHHGFLHAERGASGGYQLARSPKEISVVDIIKALEGPIALMQCNLGAENCAIAEQCPSKGPWQQINQILLETLSAVSLIDLQEGKNCR